MPKIKFTVTHPDGTVSTRSSASMDYTHAVVAHEPKAISVTRAQERVETIQGYIAAGHWEPGSDADALAGLAAAEALPEGGTWGVVAWSQSAGNAEKAARSWDRGRKGRTITVVDVDPIGA